MDGMILINLKFTVQPERADEWSQVNDSIKSWSVMLIPHGHHDGDVIVAVCQQYR